MTWLRVLAALAEDPSLAPDTWWLINIWTSGFKASDALSWPLQVPDPQHAVHKYTQKNTCRHKINKSWLEKEKQINM